MQIVSFNLFEASIKKTLQILETQEFEALFSWFKLILSEPYICLLHYRTLVLNLALKKDQAHIFCENLVYSL